MRKRKFFSPFTVCWLLSRAKKKGSEADIPHMPLIQRPIKIFFTINLPFERRAREAFIMLENVAQQDVEATDETP